MYALLKDEAYDKILAMIDRGEIRYGQTYSASWITDQLQMSKTPVRDAIHKLCDEQRLDVMPSRGFRLHELGEDEYMVRYHFSNSLEGYCVGYLADHADEEPYKTSIGQLHQLESRLRALYEEDAPFADFFGCDNAFHLQIIHIFGDAFYQKMLTMQGLYNMPEIHEMKNPVGRDKILACHDRILAGIDAHDAVAAAHAMREHADLMLRSYQDEAGE